MDSESVEWNNATSTLQTALLLLLQLVQLLVLLVLLGRQGHPHRHFVGAVQAPHFGSHAHSVLLLLDNDGPVPGPIIIISVEVVHLFAAPDESPSLRIRVLDRPPVHGALYIVGPFHYLYVLLCVL